MPINLGLTNDVFGGENQLIILIMRSYSLLMHFVTGQEHLSDLSGLKFC